MKKKRIAITYTFYDWIEVEDDQEIDPEKALELSECDWSTAELESVTITDSRE